MLGLQMIYLEAGSGAANPVPMNLIKAVRQNIQFHWQLARDKK